MILVPALVRSSLVASLRERYLSCIEALDADAEVVVDEREWPSAYPGENYWGRFARMRQAMIDEHLGEHEYVLWVDADIAFDPDLFTRLVQTHEAALVSPLVLIEGRSQNYDTAGTRPDFDHRSGEGPPEPGVHEMYSVGGCVLVPAEVHRKVRFEAQDDTDTSANTEWTSLCEGARALGYPVLWNTSIIVHHADLPRYGEAWH